MKIKYKVVQVKETSRFIPPDFEYSHTEIVEIEEFETQEEAIKKVDFLLTLDATMGTREDYDNEYSILKIYYNE